MKKLLSGLAVAALAVAPASALAHKGHTKHAKSHAKTRVLKGSFQPIGADVVYAGIAGKAQLTDNKRRDKLSVHLRHLKAGDTYTYALVEGTCAAPGAPVAGWTYKPLKANSSGNANSTARSKTFTSDPTKTYAVVVGSTQGAVYACADLRAKKAKKPHKAHKHHATPKSKSHGHH